MGDAIIYLLSIFGTLILGTIFWTGYNYGIMKTKLQNLENRLKNIDSNIKEFKDDIRSIPCSKVQVHLKDQS